MDPYQIIGIPRPEYLRPGRPRPMSPIQPLDPETEDSMLSRLGGGALSGLAWIGDTLDKYTGARGVRGALAGKPQELLSIIPGSDQMGLTNLQDKTTGRDLLGVSQDASIFSPEGLGAMGLEIALDPSTYLTFGGSALTKAGMKAASANKLVKGLRPGLEAGQRGLVGLGIPFTGLRAGAIGTGQTGLNILDKLGTVANRTGLTAAGNVIGKVTSPVARGIKSLFHAPSMGTLTEAGQQVAPAAYRQIQEGKALAREEALNLLRPMEEMGVNPDDFITWTEKIRPDQAPLGAVAGDITGHLPGNAQTNAIPGIETMTWNDIMGLPKAEQELLMPLLQREIPQLKALPNPEELKLVQQAQSKLGNILDTERGLGISVGDNPEYFPRYKTLLEGKGTKGYTVRDEGLSPLHRSQAGREEILDRVVGGRQGINKLANDKELRELVGTGYEMSQRRALEKAGETIPDRLQDLPATKLKAARLIEERYLGHNTTEAARTVRNLGAKIRRGTASPAEAALHSHLKDLNKQVRPYANALADWMQKNVDPAYAQEGLDFFGNHPVTDYLKRMMMHAQAKANADAIHDLVMKTAVPANEIVGANPERYKPLSLALSEMGLGKPGPVPSAATKSALEHQGAMRGLFGDQELKQLDKLYVPDEIIKDAARFNRAMQVPEAISGFMQGWDSLNNFTKSFLTAMWPAFHARNAVTGGFMNWVADAFNPRTYVDTLKSMKGGVIDWANKVPGLEHLNPQQATQQLHDWAYKYGLTGTGEGFFADLLGIGEHQAQRAKPVLPGSPQDYPWESYIKGWRDTFTPSKKEARNIFGVAGVGGNRVDTLGFVKGGRQAGATMDEISRMSGFLELVRKGWDPGAAAQRMKDVHYDYTKLANFEKDVMRRVAPFYNWMRHNIPFNVSQLIQEPGGKLATSIKLASDLRGDNPGFLPEWLGEGVVMPMGQNQDGTTRYLSSLGLPFEDLANMMSFRGVASGMSPYLKIPLELGTGTQLYTGRQLADLEGVTPSRYLDSVLFNSPASRFITTFNKLTDPRKGPDATAVNLLTGARLTDVDLERARDLRVNDLINEQLRGQNHVRSFTRPYVAARDMGNIDPYTMDLLRLQRTRDVRARMMR